MMRLTCFAFVLLGAFLFSGCAEPEVFSEVLQQHADQKIYTRYNLWYRDPANISTLNIQEGSFLPLGSEIEPVGTSRNHITGSSRVNFKDREGRSYSIIFDPGYRLCSLRDYIEDTFTLTPPEKMFEGIPEQSLARIKAGQVVPGMNKKEVILAYGPPPPIRTANLRNDTWLYWISPSQTIRVIFRSDKVRNILNINE